MHCDSAAARTHTIVSLLEMRCELCRQANLRSAYKHASTSVAMSPIWCSVELNLYALRSEGRFWPTEAQPPRLHCLLPHSLERSSLINHTKPSGTHTLLTCTFNSRQQHQHCKHMSAALHTAAEDPHDAFQGSPSTCKRCRGPGCTNVLAFMLTGLPPATSSTPRLHQAPRPSTRQKCHVLRVLPCA